MDNRKVKNRVSVNKISYDEWRAAVFAAETQSNEKPQEGGWKTSDELSKEWGKCKASITSMLKALVQNNLWERRDFRIFTTKGARATPHYRPINKSI